MRNGNFDRKLRPPRIHFRVLLRATWDRRLYFPSEGRLAEDFFRPDKSDGFGLG